VHKAQGSEYPAVVLVLAREHGRMLRRRLLYTAVTRAKRLLVLLAEPAALERAVETAEPPRDSLLLPRLLGRLEEGP
jgi:exodeoxyribonuclease V alpha subunit